MKNSESKSFEDLRQTRQWLEGVLRLDGPFFDEDGILRSAIDVRTLQPFTAEWAATQTQFSNPEEPFAADYVAGITYEDTWDAFGEYLEYIVARYEVTQETNLVPEMHRIVRIALDVYHEDNPEGLNDWEVKKGFFRRLYKGRRGKLAHPEILGTDQMSPLLFGVLQAKKHLNSDTQKEVDEFLVGILGFYMRRHFTYVSRGTILCSVETVPLCLSYYVPALVHAHGATGDLRYLRAFERLHSDYLCNPEYLFGDYQMPYVQSIAAAEDRFLWIHNALRWTMWIPWLLDHAPNPKFYEFLFEEFLEFNTRLLRNTLPLGLGHDYDNLGPTTQRFPNEWYGKPVNPTGEIGCDGCDIYSVLHQACLPPLRRVREHSYFAVMQPERVDVELIEQILKTCRSPDHFTYWYDPDDKILPAHMNHRSRSLQAQFVCSWLTAYWRLRKLDVTFEKG